MALLPKRPGGPPSMDSLGTPQPEWPTARPPASKRPPVKAKPPEPPPLPKPKKPKEVKPSPDPLAIGTETATDVLKAWQAPEFVKYEKDIRWFLVVATALTVFTILFLLGKNFLPAITLILLGVVIFIYAQREPRTVRYAITEDGIIIGERLHFFEDLESFWIIYDPPEVGTVYIKRRQTFLPELRMEIGQESPVELRDLLLEYLIEEEEQEESFIDQLARRLRF